VSNPSFIDAGCGIGWVVDVANHMGFDSYGIEISKENLAIALTSFEKICKDSY